MAERDENNDLALFASVEKSQASSIFTLLKEGEIIDNKLMPIESNEKIAFPIIDEKLLRSMDWFDSEIIEVNRLPVTTKNKKSTPAEMIEQNVRTVLTVLSVENIDGLMKNLPRKWELYGDLALIPNDTMSTTHWQHLLAKLNKTEQQSIWQSIADGIGVTRIGRQNKIANNPMRKSQVALLLGDSGEVEFLDNGVIFTLDVTKVMFSSGNVTERHRIGKINMAGETIVDAFAGIGYYTLPMLVNSKAEHVYACEINPESYRALDQAAIKNHVRDSLTIVKGDNKETMIQLTEIADRVLLGILPTSEPLWQNAVACLKKSGGVIHIHMNVREELIASAVADCVQKLGKMSKNLGFMGEVIIQHVEKVKWYAPRIRHIVVDAHIH